MNADSAPPHDVSASSPQSRLRFGVLDIMLLTAVIAAWSPTVVAIREIPRLTVEVDQMRSLTAQLQILDASKLCIRTLPSIWHNIHSWKYYLPEHAKLELRFATEQITPIGDPPNFQSTELPTGVHTVHLKYDSSESREFIAQVYIDDSLVLEEKHPPGWRESGGSTGTGSFSSQTETHSLDERLVLRRMQMSVAHPHKQYGSSSLPDEYDSKGNLLWIVPQGSRTEPTPRFVSPKTKYRAWTDAWGHRQGCKLTAIMSYELQGTLGIEPDFRLILDDAFRHRSALNALSIRPITDKYPDGEVPERAGVPAAPTRQAIRYQVWDNLDASSTNPAQALSGSEKAGGAMSADGRYMRVFVHYDPFPSGAKPIVEVIFDAQQPHRIGLLPHQAPDSTPLRAVQFVSKLDSLVHLRQLWLLSESEQAEAATQKAEMVPLSLVCSADSNGEWNTIAFSQLPNSQIASKPSKMLRLSSDIENFTELSYPPTVPRDWIYGGLPVSQAWYLPAEEAGAQGVRVELRATDSFPGTQSMIPGGQAVRNVRITVPMPAARAIWLAIEAPPKVDSSNSDAAPPATANPN